MIKHFLADLRCQHYDLPHDDATLDDPNYVDDPDYIPCWGYTIYRTYYGPGSDERWDELLQKLTAGAHRGLRYLKDSDDTEDDMATALSLFKLDARSDPATMDGLELEDVRKLYMEGVGGQPMGATQEVYRIFLLADAEVLVGSGWDSGVVKVSAAEYDAAACVPKNWQFGPQRYFGWMRMPTRCIMDLWRTMERLDFEELVNGTEGGPGVLWKGED